MRIIEAGILNPSRFRISTTGITPSLGSVLPRRQAQSSQGGTVLPHKTEVIKAVAAIANKHHGSIYAKVLYDLLTGVGVPRQSDIETPSVLTEYSRVWGTKLLDYGHMANAGPNKENRNQASAMLQPELIKMALATTVRTRPEVATLLGYVAPELESIASVVQAMPHAFKNSISAFLNGPTTEPNMMVRSLVEIQDQIFNQPTHQKPAKGVTTSLLDRIQRNFQLAADGLPPELHNDLMAAAQVYANEQKRIGITRQTTDEQVQSVSRALAKILLFIHKAEDKESGTQIAIKPMLKELKSVWPAWEVEIAKAKVQNKNGALGLLIKWHGIKNESDFWLSPRQYRIVMNIANEAMINLIRSAIDKANCPVPPVNQPCTGYDNVEKLLAGNSIFLGNPGKVSECFGNQNLLTAGTMGIAKMVVNACTAIRPDAKIDDPTLKKMADAIVMNVANWGISMGAAPKTGTSPFELYHRPSEHDKIRRTDDHDRQEDDQPSETAAADNQNEQDNNPKMNNLEPWSHPETIVFGSQVLWVLYGLVMGSR